MISESIVTTVDLDGQVNIAPMGPEVDSQLTTFILKPFSTSRTYQNLALTKSAVIHITDDVMLMASAAVGEIENVSAIVQPDDTGRFHVLKDCHRWFAVEVEIDPNAESQRLRLDCKVVASKVVRPFFGFNRAKHAVLEAAILATRTHLLEPDSIHQQLQNLRPLIDKTAGKDEHIAFDMLCRTINDRLAKR